MEVVVVPLIAFAVQFVWVQGAKVEIQSASDSHL